MLYEVNWLYEKCDDDVEICWGFECKCVNHGDCESCQLLLDYEKSLEKRSD